MPAIKIHPVEKLRKIWTPGREIEELVAKLDPQTELDSMVRHFLHALIQQHGPRTIELGSSEEPVLNTGVLRWEIIHGPGFDDAPHLRRRQAALWIEETEV
jgi:hypothetical protein